MREDRSRREKQRQVLPGGRGYPWHPERQELPRRAGVGDLQDGADWREQRPIRRRGRAPRHARAQVQRQEEVQFLPIQLLPSHGTYVIIHHHKYDDVTCTSLVRHHSSLVE